MDYNQGSEQTAAPQYVGVGRRFFAIIIDGIILGVVTGIISTILKNQLGLSYGIGGLIYLAYYVVLEATMGATVGKLALGLQVVNQDGTPITWSQSLIRNVLRIIDGLFAYLVGAIIIWNSPTKQRLGDKAAHTYVVRK